MNSAGPLLHGLCVDSTFEDIPVIDFTDGSSSDFAKRRALANLIRDASINVGFFYLANHGISEDNISGALEAGKRFFSLDTARKIELNIDKSTSFKGYTALLQENVNPTGLGDLHEGFDIGWEPLINSPSFTDDDTHTVRKFTPGAMSGTNSWPKNLPGFREAVLTYYHDAIKLGKLLFPLFALALDLAEDFFDDKTTRPAAIMRLLHYPPQASKIDNEDRQIGIGEHTDYECFTLLWQDSVGGLQVKNAAGKWIDAVHIPGTIVVNLGDQFARWTNDVFKSTPHRAINRSGQERYSIPLFFGTNYDVLLDPIPTCISPDSPAKYEVITAGDYVKSRLEATYNK
ncbi:putative iron/ascorbate oxidoreductase [Termitomyces sp. T112]|nr:putative iron/ascorbate oxidoreductase [Termitomyces sp. T112]